MSDALVDDASDRTQTDHAASTETDRRRARRRAVKSVLSTYDGRLFVWGELERHRIFETITVQSSLIYALSGRRDAGLELYAEVLTFPDLYLEMQREAMERSAREKKTAVAVRTARTAA